MYNGKYNDKNVLISFFDIVISQSYKIDWINKLIYSMGTDVIGVISIRQTYNISHHYCDFQPYYFL